MEFFEIYDEENLPLNFQKERSLVHRDGNWHRTSQVWVVNGRKEILCNLRSPNKDLFPNYWDLSIGGHVVAKDSYELTAKREMMEELGVNVDLQNLIFLGDEKVEGVDVEKKLIDREHARLFLYFTSLRLEEFQYQREEIVQLKFKTADELLDIIQKQNHSNFKIVPTKKHLPKILNKIKALK